MAKKAKVKRRPATKKTGTRQVKSKRTVGRVESRSRDDGKVRATAEQRQGTYANLVRLGHTDYEFLMDFFFSAAGEAPQLVSRIIMSPAMMKRMQAVVDENVRSFEAAHGPIPIRK